MKNMKLTSVKMPNETEQDVEICHYSGLPSVSSFLFEKFENSEEVKKIPEDNFEIFIGHA